MVMAVKFNGAPTLCGALWCSGRHWRAEATHVRTQEAPLLLLLHSFFKRDTDDKVILHGGWWWYVNGSLARVGHNSQQKSPSFVPLLSN